MSSAAPASSKEFSGFLVAKPTTGIPAATPARIPEGESYTQKSLISDYKIPDHKILVIKLCLLYLKDEGVLCRHLKLLEGLEVRVRRRLWLLTFASDDNCLEEV